VHTAVTITACNGRTASGFIGYSNVSTSGGGDFGITKADGPTCTGQYTARQGFDHHRSTYNHLNCGCIRHYLYSYSNVIADGDQNYKVNSALGDWTATATCSSTEGGGLRLRVGVR
jgi:hypothetical protein